MAVTKLIKKASRNKSKAKKRVREIKKSLTRNLVGSPYKEVSGMVIGSVSDVMNGNVAVKADPAPAPVAVVEEPAAEVVETAVETETTAEDTESAEA